MLSLAVYTLISTPCAQVETCREDNLAPTTPHILAPSATNSYVCFQLSIITSLFKTGIGFLTYVCPAQDATLSTSSLHLSYFAITKPPTLFFYSPLTPVLLQKSSFLPSWKTYTSPAPYPDYSIHLSLHSIWNTYGPRWYPYLWR